MNSGFDADKVEEQLDEMLDNVAVQAHIDQQSAALDRLRDNGTWWAGLAMLGMERNDKVSTAIATQHLKQFLFDQPHDLLVILASYLLHNTINLVANHYEGGDIPAAISGIVGPDDFANFEKFVATSGASCPDCGHDDGWGEHDCRREVSEDESLEG